MPTKLTKPVTRELDLVVEYAGKQRNLLVTVEADKLVFRPKGTQKQFEVNTADLYKAVSTGELCLNQECEAATKDTNLKKCGPYPDGHCPVSDDDDCDDDDCDDDCDDEV